MAGRLLRWLQDLGHDAFLTARGRGMPAVREALLYYAAGLLPRRVRYVVVEHDLALARELPAPPGVEIRVPTQEDSRPLAGGLTSRELRRLQSTHARGGMCVVAWRDGRAIGFALASPRMEPGIEDCPLPLPADAAYGWSQYVTPAERNRGVGSALLSARHAACRARGFRKLWQMVEREDEAAIRSAKKSCPGGTRPVGEVISTGVLGRCYARFAPAPAAPVEKDAGRERRTLRGRSLRARVERRSRNHEIARARVDPCHGGRH